MLLVVPQAKHVKWVPVHSSKVREGKKHAIEVKEHIVPCCFEVSVILSTGMLSVLLVQKDEAFELEGNFKRQYLFQNGASSQLHF